MATEVTDARVPQPTATSGTSGGTCPSAATAVSCVAMTMMPSTPWPRNRSTASSIDLRSRAGRLATDTKKVSCAARSNP